MRNISEMTKKCRLLLQIDQQDELQAPIDEVSVKVEFSDGGMVWSSELRLYRVFKLKIPIGLEENIAQMNPLFSTVTDPFQFSRFLSKSLIF